MAFVQVQQSLVSHRKTLRLARLLGENRYTVVGRLVALWSWCLDNALDGLLSRDIDADVLADVMGWDERMGKPADLFDALLTAGFLDLDPADQQLSIHDWYEHMGRLIEQRRQTREQDAERKRRQRERERENAGTSIPAAASAGADVTRMSRGRHADGHAGVTLQEKSREEKSIPTGQEGSQERERACETRVPPAADAALALLASASPISAVSAVVPVSAVLATGVRIADPVWDACIACMGAPPSNRVQRGKWARGIQALKESLATEGCSPGEIVTRARRYRTRFGTSIPLNPMALAGNWTELAADIQPAQGRQEGQRHGTAGNSSSARSAAYGRGNGRNAGRSSRPQIGSADYYAEAVAAQYGHG